MRDASKAKRELGWEPTVKLPELVRIMVEADRDLARAERDGVRRTGDPP